MDEKDKAADDAETTEPEDSEDSQESTEDSEESTQDSQESSGKGDDDLSDQNEVVAPSVGPNTEINYERTDPEELAERTSDVDAMGLDKRREVIGGQYGASLGKQAALYGAAIAVIAAIAIGFILLANKFDQPPEKYADEAPWTNNNTPPAQIQ
jgi:hypothetical protein